MIGSTEQADNRGLSQSIEVRCSERNSGNSNGPSSSSSAMTGTPIKNADPHQKRSSRSPPATGPMAAPVEKLVAQTPIANVRSLASENRLLIRASVDGASVAPAIP